ncbi:hypothetical protein [Thermopirellula anaerolimosa]
MRHHDGARHTALFSLVLCILAWTLAGCATPPQTSQGKVQTVQDWMKLESPQP